MLSVTMEENLERTQASRDDQIAATSSYLHGIFLKKNMYKLNFRFLIIDI